MVGKPTETADLSLWELMDSRQTDRKPPWDQPGPLHVCYRFVVVSHCSSSEIRTCLWNLAGFLEPVYHAGLLFLVLMQGEELCPAST